MQLRLLIGKFGLEKMDDGRKQTPSENDKGCAETPEAGGTPACVNCDRVAIGARARAGDRAAVMAELVKRIVLIRKRNGRLDVIGPISVNDDFVDLTAIFTFAVSFRVTLEVNVTASYGIIDEGRDGGRSTRAETATKAGPVYTEARRANDSNRLLGPVCRGGDRRGREERPVRVRVALVILKGHRTTTAVGD
jgi:hypothetical protein